ncbi:BatD family protein [Parvicella tangerina]|uniref:Protein BatD n=1 Tax=Parvicella tangerina TaxID=2829795 RepID=A0A916JNL4_9FLAO|nr:BatD family protein [Parvicella tangerina]CAG5084914.1 hypothetical protein CRYO30217_02599 [Parvicella tangerina]
MKTLTYIKSLTVVLLLSMYVNTVHGQDIYVDISCTNQYPGVGEKIKLSYILKKKLKGGMATISHSGINISKPDMKSLNVIDEGTEGSSFSFGGFGGGGDMQVSKYSFILQPTTEGEVKLAPFSFKMNGETYTSKSFTIHVGKGDPNATIVKKNANYFISIDVSKKELYPGEHAVVTYTIYSRSSNISLQKSEFPMSDAFWSEEIDPGKNGFGQTQVNIDGYAYLKIPVKKQVIFAKEAGVFEIPPCSAELVVGGGFFSQGTLEKLQSNAPKLTVKSLPSGAPDSFQGQVGKDYDLEVSYSTTKLKAGEPIDVIINLTGKGNLNKLAAPELSFPLDFDAYEPEVSGSINLSMSNGFSGNRKFNYLVIPRHHGTYEVPAFEYSYFDLASKTYKTLSHPAQTIEVEKSNNSTPATVNGGTSTPKEDVEVLNEEIRHIAYNTELTSSKTTFFKTTLFWTGLTVPLGLTLAGFLFAIFRPKETKKDKKKTAGKKVFKTLKAAEQKLSAQDNLGFYDELYKGLMQYLSNKLETPFSDLTKESIVEKLGHKELSKSVLNILESCEMARYTPISSEGAQDTMNKTKSLIQQIEKHVS